LGTATLEFIFNREVRAAVNARSRAATCFLGNSFLRSLVAWFEKGDDIERDNKQTVLKECWRLTEKAIAYFISQASRVNTKDLVTLLNSYTSFPTPPITSAATNLNSPESKKDEILNNILLHLHELAPSGGLVAKIICALFEDGRTVRVSMRDPFLDALVASMQKVRPFPFYLLFCTCIS
jgi:hypothetical protein